jgi:DNA-binding winged helix-turn-helix (wHTH) protein
MCQPIALFCDQDISHHIGLIKKSVSQVDIYLRDISDMSYMHSLVKDIALSLPAVGVLNFMLEYPNQIVSHPSIILLWM